jgi:hypothetical protein
VLTDRFDPGILFNIHSYPNTNEWLLDDARSWARGPFRALFGLSHSDRPGAGCQHTIRFQIAGAGSQNSGKLTADVWYPTFQAELVVNANPGGEPEITLNGEKISVDELINDFTTNNPVTVSGNSSPYCLAGFGNCATYTIPVATH